MTGFTAEWLALRAPADDAARDEDLRRAAARYAGDGLVADLGGGTGATFRALSPMAPNAKWRVLDDDPALLARLPAEIEAVRTDLAGVPETAFAPQPRLVSASAFFDLTSAAWIERFADLLAEAKIALYAALSYDGREIWTPAPSEEAAALAAFHQDMRRDKGFGPALGPDAHDALVAALRARGYKVREATSDWRLSSSEDGALIAALAGGGLDAVGEALEAPERWGEERAAATEVLIGHKDLFATPPA